MVPSWGLGVAACLCGAFCGTFGGQLRMCALAFAGRPALLLEVFGWAFWLTGQGLGQVAILLAPATVAACVTFSSSLFFNALLAPWVLHERLSRLHGLGVVLLSVGGTAVTWASCHSDPFFSWPEIVMLPERPPTVALFSSAWGAAVLLMLRAAKARDVDICSFAYWFALIGATDLVVTKVTLQLLRLQVLGGDPGTLPRSDVTLALTAAMLTLHVLVFVFQVVSVQFRKALQSVPLFLGSGAIMQISLSGAFFNEFDFTPAQAAVFVGGVALVLSGLVVTSHAAPSRPEGEDGAECVEGAEAAVVVEDSIAHAVQASMPDGAWRSSAAPGSEMTRSAATNGLAVPIISSGLLSRSNSSFSNADLFFVGEIQRSAMCFGGGAAPLGPRLSTSLPSLHQPLLRSVSSSFPVGSAPALFDGVGDSVGEASDGNQEATGIEHFRAATYPSDERGGFAQAVAAGLRAVSRRPSMTQQP